MRILLNYKKRCLQSRILLFSLFFISAIHAQSISGNIQYVCLPCGSDCDNITSSVPGNCMHCNMPMVDKATILFKNISPATLCALVAKDSSIVLLDVRTREEFNGTSSPKYGRLKNAINIPIQELEQRIGELSRYKSRSIVVYCSHSHRSPKASYLLNQKGFKNVMNMLGGMSVWKQEVSDKRIANQIYVAQ